MNKFKRAILWIFFSISIGVLDLIGFYFSFRLWLVATRIGYHMYNVIRALPVYIIMIIIVELINPNLIPKPGKFLIACCIWNLTVTSLILMLDKKHIINTQPWLITDNEKMKKEVEEYRAKQAEEEGKKNSK